MIENLIKDGIKALPPYMMGGDTIESVKERYNLDTVYRLSANENQIGVSPMAVEAIINAVSKGNCYPGSGDLVKEKLAKKYTIENTRNFSSDNFIITIGASGQLNLVGEMFICKGDEVIFSELSYPQYKLITMKNEGIPIEIPINKETMEIDLDGMYNAISDKTKLIWICNPNNPTGTILNHDKLVEFINKVPENIMVIVDEAYFEFINEPGYESMAKYAVTKPNVIVLRTFSKIYGLAGIRIGYSIAHNKTAHLMMKISGNYGTSSLAYAAACAAMDDYEFFNKTRNSVIEGRNYLITELKRLGFKVWNSQTNFVYTDTGMDAFALAEKLKEYGIIIRGNFPVSRISVGTMEQNEAVISAIKDIVEKGELAGKESFYAVG
ncbi:MAG TPA: histidinol-phosphate transaminase [Clostridium sp.]|nr:histidinol-phosphate transaminase [Clostridium sp.]